MLQNLKKNFEGIRNGDLAQFYPASFTNIPPLIRSRPGELGQFYSGGFSSIPPLIRDRGSWRSFWGNGPRARQFFEFSR